MADEPPKELSWFERRQLRNAKRGPLSPRVIARREERMDRIYQIVDRLQLQAAKDLDLKKHIFKDDLELIALGLSKSQIKKVRQWEMPKKFAAYATESAQLLVQSTIKQRAVSQGAKINVETAIIQIPEKREDDQPAVIIDIVAENK